MNKLVLFSFLCLAWLFWGCSISSESFAIHSPTHTETTYQQAPSGFSNLIGEIRRFPTDCIGELIEIVGYLLCLDLPEEMSGPLPVRRSDRVITDITEAIYFAGMLHNLGLSSRGQV